MQKKVTVRPPDKRRTLRQKVLTGAEHLKRDPVANTQQGIKILLGIAKQPKRQYLLRKASSTLGRLLDETPRDGRKIVRRLVEIDATHSLSMPTVVRIFAAPLSFTTLRTNLRQFARKQISFVKLMNTIEGAYEKAVPRKEMHKILHCKQGKFYHRIWNTTLDYRRPRSLITNATIKRMYILKKPDRMIAEAKDLKRQIHTQAHTMYEAVRAGDKATKVAATKEMRRLQNIFIENFTKKL